MGCKLRPKPSKPIYKHYCNNCVFLGTFEKSDGEYNTDFYDLYWCPLDEERCVVARYGNNEHDCFSGKVSSIFIPALIEAKKLARKKGLKVD